MNDPNRSSYAEFNCGNNCKCDVNNLNNVSNVNRVLTNNINVLISEENWIQTARIEVEKE